MNLDCIIIDDEPLALELLEGYINQIPFLNLQGKYTNAVEALEVIKTMQPHIVFLDIQMPNINGLELSKIIDGKTKVIFTTAFDNYALESYKVNALDYLLKPISYTDFLTAANKALNWFEMTTKDEAGPTKPKINSIFVKTEYKLMQINFSDILYVEGMKDYVKIFIENQPHPILTLMNMKTLEDQLPEEQFVRVHRSFIVQPCKIKYIERNRIVFSNQQYIPISDSYKDSFQAFLNKHSIVG